MLMTPTCRDCGGTILPEHAKAIADGFIHYPVCPVPYQVERDFADGGQTWDWVTFPNGARLIYVEVPGDRSHSSDHTYWRVNDKGKRGTRLANVSNMVGIFDNNPGRFTEIGMKKAAETGQADPEEWRLKRELGTRVHGAFEGLADGRQPNPNDHPDMDRGWLRGIVDWWKIRRPRVLGIEQFVYHGELNYGGRFDLLCEIGGKIVRVDLKTGRVYPKSDAQLVAYNLAAEWCGLGAADESFLLKVDGLGDWKEVPSFITREEFLMAMSVRQVSARVERQQTAALEAA